MKNTFLNDLNEAQREAVVHSEGPSLVIAGAGSGKTRVLTYRIANLLGQGIDARNILALTFTNKAAAEMKERIGNLVGFNESRYLWMGTFHSVFARILRAESKYLGFTSNFTIYDTIDSKSLIRSIIKDLKLDDKSYGPGEVFGRISSAKNNLVTPQAYAATSEITRQDSFNGRPLLSEIYKMYVNRCKKADAMDFDDLLMNTNILFRDLPEVLKKYQDIFHYILVDEYQDTNFAQYLIVQKLAALRKNVCVVGDDAQSIYSFRGAKIENILNFRNDYPGYKLFKLEQNYRSTQTIVNAANSLIAKNKEQIQKKVWSAKEAGDKIKVVQTSTDGEEGFVIANAITDLRLTKQVNYHDFAILYRTNAQSRIFEESLRKKNIPYKVYGSLSFYQRKEVKDILAYFRLAINPHDEEALRRVINYPARGIGDTTMDKIREFGMQKDQAIWDIITRIDHLDIGINKGTQAKLLAFSAMIEGFGAKLESMNAYELGMHIAAGAGLMQDLRNDKSPEGVSRFENIQELLNSIGEFVDSNKENGDSSLARYLENVSLLTDADKEKPEDKDKVSVMTVHAAKGLEFEYIFLAGLEEDLFPNRMSIASAHELEEERRLFYVGLTRAKQQAMITWAQTRYKWGVPDFCQPSRFIREIDPQFLEVKSNEDKGRGFKPSFSNVEEQASFEKPIPRSSPQPTLRERRLIKIPGKSKSEGAPVLSSPESMAGIAAGSRVIHERFGTGTVTLLEGQEPNIKAIVNFDAHGTKQLLLKFAHLKVINEG